MQKSRHRLLRAIRKARIIRDLEENIYCRLKPSRIHGVGVYAIRPIPKGVNPFRGCYKNGDIGIPVEEITSNKKIHPAVKEILCDFYAVQDGSMYLPCKSLNAIDISFFLNHSKRPNMQWNAKQAVFRAKRSIRSGEELTADYDTYADKVNIQ